MKQPVNKPAEPEKGKHYIEEADIGSGEKSPGEKETEEQIRKIPPLPGDAKPSSAAV